MPSRFNSEMLLLARQIRGATQQTIAARVGIKQSYYSKLENGLLYGDPSASVVRAIGRALSFPASFFYQPDRLAGPALSVHPMNRRKASVPAAALKRVHSELNLRLLHLRRLLRAIDLDQELPRPHLDADENQGPANIALCMRRTWGIPDGPISNLTEYCERAGILVVKCELDAGLDGVTMRASDLPPCVFLNRNKTADRMRFTLAHELGHIVMHQIASDDIEDEANRFAGEFLVPARDLASQVIGSRVTIEFLARLKAYWRTSMQFLLFRIGQEGLINQHQKSYLWRQFSMNGWRLREPEETDIDHEIPRLFRQILRLHQEDLGYSLVDLRRLLCVRAGDLFDMYGEDLLTPRPAQHLRLVKEDVHEPILAP